MRAVILAVLGVSAVPTPALAGASPEHVYSDEKLLSDWRHDVYVVTVKSVQDKGATNGAPPRLVLVVEEALRGELRRGATLGAIWSPFPHAYDTGSRRKERAAWSGRPLAGPKVGEKLIVLGRSEPGQEPFLVSPRCRYRFTAADRSRVAALMGDWRRMRREAAAQVRAQKRAADRAAAADMRAQARADLRALYRRATDIAECECWSSHQSAGGWVMEVRKARSVKRPSVRLDGDGTGTLYVWTRRDPSKVVEVRCRRNGAPTMVLMFLGSLPPDLTGKLRNGYALIGGELGFLEATRERRAQLQQLSGKAH